LDEAEQRGWITHAIRPKPINDGIKTESRGSFTRDEYKMIYTELRRFHKTTDKPVTAATREVLRNYVLILANTGMRHGTEALDLKWKNLLWITERDETYLGLFVDGKTGQRPLVARDRAVRPFERQVELNPALSGMTLNAVIDAKLDEYVFVTRLGQRAVRANLSRNYEKLLDKLDLVYGADGKKRTLYSWRHFYATLDLQRGVSTHVLSRQMGNSTGVLDRFYSKLSPFMNPGLHSGRADRSEKLALKAALANGAQLRAEPDAVEQVDQTPTIEPDIPGAPVPPPTLSAAAKAFDLFDAGKLSEATLLIAVGVSREGYALDEDLRIRALTALEQGRLSEDALIKVLG